MACKINHGPPGTQFACSECGSEVAGGGGGYGWKIGPVKAGEITFAFGGWAGRNSMDNKVQTQEPVDIAKIARYLECEPDGIFEAIKALAAKVGAERKAADDLAIKRLTLERENNALRTALTAAEAKLKRHADLLSLEGLADVGTAIIEYQHVKASLEEAEDRIKELEGEPDEYDRIQELEQEACDLEGKLIAAEAKAESGFRDGIEAAAKYIEACRDYGWEGYVEAIRALSPSTTGHAESIRNAAPSKADEFYDWVLSVCENPPEPNEKLKALFREYKDMQALSATPASTPDLERELALTRFAFIEGAKQGATQDETDLHAPTILAAFNKSREVGS